MINALFSNITERVNDVVTEEITSFMTGLKGEIYSFLKKHKTAFIVSAILCVILTIVTVVITVKLALKAKDMIQEKIAEKKNDNQNVIDATADEVEEIKNSVSDDETVGITE